MISLIIDFSVYQETHQDSSKFYTPASNTAVSLFRIVVSVSVFTIKYLRNRMMIILVTSL
jgi:hypothetical protein